MRFALTGVRVTIGSRDAARAVEVAHELSERHAAASIAGASNEDTIAGSNVVILAIPFVHAGAMVDACRDVFVPGTLVIDVTVPLIFDGGKPRFVEPAEGSAAEHLRPAAARSGRAGVRVQDAAGTTARTHRDPARLR